MIARKKQAELRPYMTGTSTAEAQRGLRYGYCMVLVLLESRLTLNLEAHVKLEGCDKTGKDKIL